MPLRQIARTPNRPFPPRDGYGAPYAFALSIVRRRIVVGLDTLQDIVIVRCPWCGNDEETIPDTDRVEACSVIGIRYVVAIPAGTPVLA